VENRVGAAHQIGDAQRVNEDLWVRDQPDDLDLPVTRRRHTHSAADARHIGCPLWWFTTVFPVVRGKNELAVALYLYRLRVVRHSHTVTISNERLLDELGIDRYAKYRALHRLANAGIIRVKRRNKRTLEVSFNPKRARARL
jgi:hypothetical protein